MIVVKIGGCNGSGKTSMVRALIALVKAEPYVAKLGDKRPTGYYAKNSRTRILGSYETECGGMDTIGNKEEIRALLHNCVDSLPNEVIIFEGLITGKTYGYIGELSERKEQKGSWIYAFMDTPFDICVDRVNQRRTARGTDTPVSAERTMRPTYKSCLSVKARALKEGHQILNIPHTLPPEGAAKYLLNSINIMSTK